MPPGLSSAQRTSLSRSRSAHPPKSAPKPKSGPRNVGTPVKRRLGGSATTISPEAWDRQMDAFHKGTRKRPPQKKVAEADKRVRRVRVPVVGRRRD